MNNKTIIPSAPVKSCLSRYICQTVLYFSCVIQILHAESDFTGPQIDFKSALLNSTVVTAAVFEKELFISGVPNGARKQVLFLKLDGENYFLGTLPNINDTNYTVLGGHFQDTVWEASPNYVTFFDRLHNTNNDAPVLATETVMRMTADLFMNFGITELSRQSASWVDGQNRIVAKSKDGSDLIIDFEGDVKSPSKALIRNQHGETVSYIKYKYNPQCFEGNIPCEFTRYYYGAPNEDVGKVFTVRVKRLRLSKDRIPVDALDPYLAFKFSHIAFYSNDVLFWKGSPHGEPQRVLTAEEAARQLPAYVKNPHGGKYARILLFSIFGFSTVAMVVLIRNKQNNTTKTNENNQQNK